jgi:catechol 2,3-dioxygenase-like lactoylglutathione lyase family enzyme
MATRSSRSLETLVTGIARSGLAAALGAAAVLAPLGRATAQGQCKGRPAEHTPACDTSPAKAPFASTGWKTVAVDHFTMDAVDYQKEAAYYAALMNWKIRSDDGKQAVLDIGDIATVVIRGGYTPPPPPPPPVVQAGDTTGGRRGGRGRGPRTPPKAVWSMMSFQIAPWNAKNVKAELEKRGLNPVADNDGHGFESFRVKDPDGFDVQISNGAYAKARKAAVAKTGLGSAAPAPFEPTNWHTVWLDHISFGVSNYKESVAWYQALLGWIPTGDEGSQNETWICEDCGNVIIRGGNPMNTARPMPAVRRASIGHISFGIDPFDWANVKADLDKRGLNGREDTGSSLKIDDPKALYKSYHTTTPQGFDLQISNGTKANRTVR